MRRNEDTKGLTVICNMCGRKLTVKGSIVEEGVIEIAADWGYFSQKDGEIHRFDICEDCYDKLSKKFKVPVDIVRKTEMI
jgi:ribosomal-protein-alanine N-acetyltransferase